MNYIFLYTGVAGDGRVDRQTWKTMQLIMGDSQKFCEFMNNYEWRKGLSEDVLNSVVGFFAPGEEVPEQISKSSGKLSVMQSSSPDRRGIYFVLGYLLFKVILNQNSIFQQI